MTVENPYGIKPGATSVPPPQPSVKVPPPIMPKPVYNPYWTPQVARRAAIGIPGALALILVSAVCIRYVIHGSAEDVPEIFKYAFTTILGFYFGVGTSSSISKTTKAE